MKAAWCKAYGPPDTLELREVAKPDCPADGLLIRVEAATVNSGDARIRAVRVPSGFGPVVRIAFGLRRPRQPILGMDLAGTIEKVGARVEAWKPGDTVVANTGMAMGAHAEFVAAGRKTSIVKRPAGLSAEDAVALSFGATTADFFLRRAGLTEGARVLINGASGAVGTMAVQLASHAGAQVTAVCSGANAGLVRSLGAMTVLDYAKADFVQGGERYDIVMDCIGNVPFEKAKPVLAAGGKFVLVVGSLAETLLAGFNRSIVAGTAEPTTEDIARIMALAKAGALRPVIDSTYPLERIVEAHRRVDSGRKRGAVVVTMADR